MWQDFLRWKASIWNWSPHITYFHYFYILPFLLPHNSLFYLFTFCNLMAIFSLGPASLSRISQLIVTLVDAKRNYDRLSTHGNFKSISFNNQVFIFKQRWHFCCTIFFCQHTCQFLINVLMNCTPCVEIFNFSAISLWKLFSLHQIQFLWKFKFLVAFISSFHANGLWN